MGVAMLPRFAAIVSITTSLRIRSSRPIMRKTRIVKGTKVINATSFVITILLKKHKNTSTNDRFLRLPAFFRREVGMAHENAKKKFFGSFFQERTEGGFVT